MTIQINGINYLTMGDAAFVQGLNGTSFEIGAGYLGGPFAYHVWSDADWKALPGYKLPIWVGGYQGAAEGSLAVKALRALGVPEGKSMALDLETRVDISYVNNFGAQVIAAGYKVWVYGSASTVFGNPKLNGYWVADYKGIGPYMWPGQGVRSTQYAAGQSYDSSLVKEWEIPYLWT
jgi:hypothetical protein